MSNGVIAKTIRHINANIIIRAQDDDKKQKVTYGESDEEALDDKKIDILLHVLVTTYNQNEEIEDHSNEGKTSR